MSFSLAAQDLNISQAAVSQQMRQLETYLDTALFVRHHRRLSLTSTGQAYLDAVHEALDRLDAVTDQLFPGQNQQSVTLHCTSGVAALWLVPRLKAFHKSHPNIEVRIRTLEQIDKSHKTRAPDFEILIAGNVENDADSVQLLTSIITPVCSPKLFTQHLRPVRAEDILKLELIHVLGYDDDWHRWFRKHVEDDVNVPRGLLVDGSLIAIEAAQRGDGVMLGRRPFIDHHLRSGDLVEVFSNPCHLYADYYLRQSPESISRRECTIVADWLAGLAGLAAQESLPEGSVTPDS